MTGPWFATSACCLVRAILLLRLIIRHCPEGDHRFADGTSHPYESILRLEQEQLVQVDLEERAIRERYDKCKEWEKQFEMNKAFVLPAVTKAIDEHFARIFDFANARKEQIHAAIQSLTLMPSSLFPLILLRFCSVFSS